MPLSCSLPMLGTGEISRDLEEHTVLMTALYLTALVPPGPRMTGVPLTLGAPDPLPLPLKGYG